MNTFNTDIIIVNTLINNTINTHANNTINPINDDIILDINPEQLHQDEQEPISL